MSIFAARHQTSRGWHGGMAVALGLLVACQANEKLDIPGLVTPEASDLAVTAAQAVAGPGALSAFLRAPKLADQSVGAFSVSGRATVTVTSTEPGSAPETLTNEFTARVAANGDYHLVDNNSADYGREVTSLGDTLYLRPRYGKWHQRPAQANEAQALLGGVLAGFGDHVDLVVGGIAIKDAAATTHHGRAAHTLRLAQASGTKPPPETLTQRKWRETIAVTKASGQVVLDDQTGLVLGGTLAATVTFTREGQTITMTIEAKQQLSPGDVQVTPPPPAEVIQTPQRARDVDDAKTLLKGL